jgi:hypothetical protein
MFHNPFLYYFLATLLVSQTTGSSGKMISNNYLQNMRKGAAVT